MTIQSPKQLMNVSTATAITYLCLPDILPTSTRTAVVATVGVAVLTIPDSQQANFRLASSIASGAAISWKLMPEDTSAKGFVLYTLFASVASYLAQEKIESVLTSNPTIIVQATTPTSQHTHLSLLSSLSPSSLIQSAITSLLNQSRPHTGPQTVAQTAQMQAQREPVGRN
jgi:hypothetical protein